MMRYPLHWLDAYRGLRTRPFRSFLTLMSMTLGVGALFVLLQLKCLAMVQIEQVTAALGPRALSVWWLGKNTTRPVTLTQLEALNKQPHLDLYPFASTSLSAQYQEAKLTGRVIGVSKALLDHVQWPLQAGTLHVSTQNPWVWVGARLAAHHSMTVGDTLWVDHQAFQIAGIFEPLPINPIFDFDLNANLFVMIEDIMAPWQSVEHALIYFQEDWNLAEVKQIFSLMFNNTFGEYKLFFKDETLLNDHIRRAMASYQTAFTWIAAVALVLALVSLVAQQWLSFLERKGECGMRLSLGASPAELMSLFINEALILGLMGVTLGLIAGSAALVFLTHQLQWPFSIDYTTALWTVLGCILISGLGGFIPAFIAASSDPTKLLAAP